MIKKIDEKNYEVDGVQVWISWSGKPRCTECSGALVAMSASCKHARAVARLINRVPSKRISANERKPK